jgi:hypothetical protein
MPKVALICVVALGAAALACAAANAGAPSPDADAETTVPSGPPKGYICGDKAFTGSGPGFKSSQEESEEAALKDWRDKAGADADWNTAKDPILECVKQGLYSKCFATGVPCHPKPKE